MLINEIMYDFPGNDTNHEWIELYNAGPDEINLTDWKFNDGDGATNHALNPPPKNGSRGSLILSPGGYLILTGNASTTVSDLPNFNGSIIDTVMNLSNTSATSAVLKILDKDGAEIISAAYAKEMGANGNGKTLEWDGNTFKESSGDNGTPGGKNSVLLQSSSPPSSDNNATSSQEIAPPEDDGSSAAEFPNYSNEIFINEFLASPAENEKEWVELFNHDSGTIDLSDWQIDDGPEQSSPQKISAGTLIEPEQYLVILLNKNILNDSGDQVRLLWPDSQIIHSVSYKNAKEGFSSARFENGLWLWTNQPTPGWPNKESLTILVPSQKSEQQSFPPAQNIAEAVSETTNELDLPKSKQSADEKTQLSQINSTDLAAAAMPLAAPLENNNSSTDSKSSDSRKLFMFLAGIIILSFLSGLGLVYFRRKNPVDKK